MAEKLLTIDEVATQLRVHETTVQRHMQARRIKFARVGRAVRFRQVWVDDFLDRDGEGPFRKDINPSFS